MKKETLRLKPEVKKFMSECRLMRNILGIFTITFVFTLIFVAILSGSEGVDSGILKLTMTLTVFICGVFLILGTLADMLMSLFLWLIRHEIKLGKVITVEEKNIDIV